MHQCPRREWITLVRHKIRQRHPPAVISRGFVRAGLLLDERQAHEDLLGPHALLRRKPVKYLAGAVHHQASYPAERVVLAGSQYTAVAIFPQLFQNKLDQGHPARLAASVVQDGLDEAGLERETLCGCLIPDGHAERIDVQGRNDDRSTTHRGPEGRVVSAYLQAV